MGFNSGFKGLRSATLLRLSATDFLWRHFLFPPEFSGTLQSSKVYVLLTVHLGIIFVNKQLETQFFFMYVYFYSLHVSGSHVPIIRGINCINTTSGKLVSHSVQMKVWCARLDETQSYPNLQTRLSSIQSDMQVYQMSY